MNEDEEIVTYGDTTLFESDVVTLTGPYWLTDRVIAFAYEWFAATVPPSLAPSVRLLNPDAVMLLHLPPAEAAEALEGLDLASAHTLFVPMNDHTDVMRAGGTHWSLLVVQGGAAWVADSLARRPGAARTARALGAVLRRRLALHEWNAPQQENGADCGVFVLLYTRALLAALAAGRNVADETFAGVDSAAAAALRTELLQLVHSLAHA